MEEKKLKLLERVLSESKKEIMKENLSLVEKTKITKIVKFLIKSGVDDDALQKVLDFYKYYDSGFELEDLAVAQEFKDSLKVLAKKDNITIPDELL